MESLTLNQIVARIKEIGESHKQLKQVEFGNFIDLNSQNNLTYPCFLIDVDTPRFSNADRKLYFTFQFMFLDLANVAENSTQNELEVWSDLTSIAGDIFSLMRLPEYQKNDWTFDNETTGEYLREAQKDIVMGVSFPVTISTFFNNNRCQVPTV